MCQDTNCTCQMDTETAAERFIELWETNYTLQEETDIQHNVIDTFFRYGENK